MFNRILISAFLMIFSLNFFNCNNKKENEIEIGAILPLTGNSSQYGSWIKEALELGREEINSEGGINGKELKIIYEDDQANPKIAVSIMEKFSSINKVPIVFGSWASSCVLAQAPIAEKNEIVILAEAISPKIKDAGDFIFRIQPDAKYYLKAIIPFILNELKIKEVAIIYANNDFGEDQATFFKKEFENSGGTITYYEGFPQGKNDFKDILTKLKQSNPKAIFAPCYTEIGFILKQAKELNIESQFIASVPFENPVNLETASNAAEETIYPYHFVLDSLSEIGITFYENYKKKYGREPEGFAVLAYDAIRIIAEVLKKCESNSSCIRDELYKIKDFPGVTGKISFDNFGEVSMPIFIKTVKNGKFVLYKQGI